MADMKKLLHTFDEADEILNDKIERTNLSTIVASATASVENKKTVLIRGTGRNIEVLKVGGKTVQNGTPTPTNPVEVKGVGDKTVNIFDLKSWSKNGVTVTRGTASMVSNGFTITANAQDAYTTTYSGDSAIPIIVKPNTKYTMSWKSNNNKDGIVYVFDIAGSKSIVSANNPIRKLTFTSPSGQTSVALRFGVSNSGDSITFTDIQIEEGETVTEYEPYGKYKIPILTDGKSQDIYLDAPLFDGEIADLVGGKVDKKYGIKVFDGSADEIWTEGSYSSKKYYATDVIPDAKKTSTIKCSYNSSTSTVVADENAFINDVGKVVLCTQGLSNVDALKTKLAANPMIVVYPLSASTTESFDGAVIPVSAAETELTLNTDVIPSSIEVVTFGDYYTKSEVDKMIGKWAVKAVTLTSTAPNKLEYTGISIDVPANSAMMISVLNQYSNSEATSTVISWSDTSATGYNVLSSGIASAFAIYNNNTNSVKTFYVWSAHKEANANPVIVSYKPV